MSNYSKLFGSLLGSLAGIGVSLGMFDEPSPELVGALATVMAAAFTYAFPANKPAK